MHPVRKVRGVERMTIQEARADDKNEPRQLKVTVPTEVLIRLHSLKILTGKNISDQVQEALYDYFDALEDQAQTEAVSQAAAGATGAI